MKQSKQRSWVAALGYRPKSLDLFSGKMTPGDLGNEVMAGLTVGMIALPLALALGIFTAIIATQTGDFLGIHTDEPAPREFIERLHWLGNHLPDMHLPSVLLAAGCLAVIMLWPRLGFRQVLDSGTQ